eukprot:4948067-Pleurochrysis_carterae.AAC.1
MVSRVAARGVELIPFWADVLRTSLANIDTRPTKLDVMKTVLQRRVRERIAHPKIQFLEKPGIRIPNGKGQL